MGSMEPPALVQAVDAIGHEEFLTPTMIASGHETVADVIAESPEFVVLLRDVEASSRLLRARYERAEDLPDETRLAYFVFFGLARDREAVPLLRSYLEKSRGMAAEELLSPWHPFLHGMKALEQITEGQVRAPSGARAVSDIDDFLRQIEIWLSGGKP